MATADRLNQKSYHALTVMLTVSDIEAAASFYEKAFGFERRGVMKGPQNQHIHAELTLRGTHLMLTPAERGARNAKSVGHSPVTLVLYVDDVDATIETAKKLGAHMVGQVENMFWGDRRGHVLDQDGYDWMISTHVADYSLDQLKAINVTFVGDTASFPKAKHPSDPPAFKS